MGDKVYSKEGELISNKVWSDYKKILQAFGQRVDGEPTPENQKFLWESIINIRNNYQEDIKQAIRINLQICYVLEINEQIKNINNPLFKINHLFDQDFYRFDNNSYLGLKKYYKLMKSTYGSLDNFLSELKLVKENLYFIRKRFDEVLISDYLYLKKISLPLRGYEDLRIALFTILKKITHIRSLLTNPKIFSDLKEEISDFKKRYKRRYIKEHQNYQEKLINFNQRLRALPEYKALNILSDIKVINVAYNLKPIKKYIDEFFPKQCQNKSLNDILDKKSKCYCGFNLGEVLAIPSINKIKPMLKKGIYEYLEQLQNKKFVELINNYLKFKPESPLRIIFNINEMSYEEILKILDKNLINDVNEALNHTYPIKISLEEIWAGIVGTYHVDNIKELGEKFEHILVENIKEKAKKHPEVSKEDLIINIIK